METNIVEAGFIEKIKLLDTTAEQSIDADFTMPDYYPEIARILKCHTEVNILSKQIVNDGISVGGQAVITLYYIDPENKLNSHTHYVPFTKIVECKDISDDSEISVKSCVNYINSRATGPRKIEIHGSLGLNIFVFSLNNKRCVVEAEGECLFSKNDKIDCMLQMLPITKNILIDEDFMLGQNCESIGRIINSHSNVKLNECKFVSGKAIVKGDLCLEILYCAADSGKICKHSDIFNFSQIIDAENIEDNTECDCSAEILGIELHPKTSLDGEIKMVNFEAKVEISISPIINTQPTFVTDAFSSDYETEVSMSNVVVEQFKFCLKEKYLHRKSLDFTDGVIANIHDIWGVVSTDYLAVENSELIIKGTLLFNILGETSDGVPNFLEKTTDFECRYPVDFADTDVRFLSNVYVSALNYSIVNSGSVDISAEIALKVSIFSYSSISIISNINIDENKRISKDNDTAITLYFAENESVWQVAKRYCASPRRICKANNIDDFDCVCNKMMLIPNA